MKDELGIEWLLDEDIKAKSESTITDNTSSYLAAPFTGLASQDITNSARPFLFHDIATNMPFLKQHRASKDYSQTTSQLVSSWGESSESAIDFNKLVLATKKLVSGVIKGDKNTVLEALNEGADPDMNISVLNDIDNKYSLLPIGAASIIYAKQLQKLPSSQLQSLKLSAENIENLKKIGRLLLINDNKSKINVGANPDNNGLALSFKTLSAEDNSVETRLVPLSMSNASAIMNVLPESMDNPVEPSSKGVALGEEANQDNYLNLYDYKNDTLKQRLLDFQKRVAKNAHANQDHTNYKNNKHA